MTPQSMLVISLFIVGTMVWILHNLRQRRLTAGQAGFWLILLAGAEVLTLFPSLADVVGRLFRDDLLPVSWISFAGLLSLIVYLLYLSMKVNRQREEFVRLVRELALKEEHKPGEAPDDDA